MTNLLATSHLRPALSLLCPPYLHTNLSVACRVAKNNRQLFANVYASPFNLACLRLKAQTLGSDDLVGCRAWTLRLSSGLSHFAHHTSVRLGNRAGPPTPTFFD
ncbi:hypothetical protein FRC12_016958 [Ceratobasidium sp. 428]|nr:hypothetical protein FRC12_016958 [Ceratobasidium sp. 428]